MPPSPFLPLPGFRDRVAHLSPLIRQVAAQVLTQHGYTYIETPIVERHRTFTKQLGESEIMKKEIFQVGEDKMLRVEGTAGVARAYSYMETQLPQPARLWYAGAMFRKEQPQLGRYRQFEQIGAEFIQAKKEPYDDVQSIEALWTILMKMQIDHPLTLEISHFGTPEIRLAYTNSLIAYLSKYRSELSKTSQLKLDSNPLRTLESTELGDRQILENAPSILDYLDASSKKSFATFQNLLEELSIPFRVNPRLIRGLEYYTGIVFEVKCAPEILGRSQSTIAAGGRYDRMVPKWTSGNFTLFHGATGWAIGVDRVSLVSSLKLPRRKFVCIVPELDADYTLCLQISRLLRQNEDTDVLIADGDDKLKRKVSLRVRVENGTITINGSEVKLEEIVMHVKQLLDTIDENPIH